MTEDIINNEINKTSAEQPEQAPEGAQAPIDESKTKNNFKIPWFNLFLLAALIVLYILFFTKKPPQPQLLTKVNKGASLSVAFVNSDTIMKRYNLVKNMKEQLEAEAKLKENELVRTQTAFEQKVANYKNMLEENKLSISGAQDTEKKLMEEQQRLYELKELYTSQIAEKEYNLNLQLQDSIINFLKRFNKLYNFDYILGYSVGGGILYANDTLDITPVVIDELNKEYDKINPKK